MKKKVFLTVMAAILMFPLVAAHGQDDDDKLVLRPPALKPGERPADEDFSCPYAKGYRHPQRFGGYSLRLLPGTKTPSGRCRASVTSAKGVVTTVARDWALTVDKISGTDINGDGKAELVITGYSGGERCCFTYTIVRLGGSARTIRKIESHSPLTFEKQSDGSVLIEGADSSFDFFLVPHSMAVIPQVVLRMQGNSLFDISAQFPAPYDRLIEEARGQLTSADLERFRRSSYNDKLFSDQIPTVRRVLVIVLNYLYSGREAQGWQALQELWPVSDQERIKALLLERRGRGLLKQTDPAKPAS